MIANRPFTFVLTSLCLCAGIGCTDEGIGPEPTLTDAFSDSGGSIVDLGVIGGADSDRGPEVWGCTADSCAAGYACFNPGGDVTPTCLPDGGFACSPCTSDAVCLGGSCTEVGGDGKFCLIPCASSGAGSTCPSGFACTSGQCLPVSSSCTCGPGNSGATQGCRTSDGNLALGACATTRTCVGASGWTTCNIPAASSETCNGSDDDCDGLTDEDLGGSACGIGHCSGSTACKTGIMVCIAASAVTETCNGVDDDCNGITDDGFLMGGLYVTSENCGVCGHSCADSIDNGSATCGVVNGKPTCIVDSCNSGFWASSVKSCTPTVIFSCLACSGPSACGGDPCVDGFCRPACNVSAPCLSGYSCVSGGCQPGSGTCTCSPANGGSVKSCFVSNSFGSCPGSMTCNPDLGWSACGAMTPSAESCNGQDDDCDGTTDEDVGDGLPCAITNSFGSCQGTWSCSGQGLKCSAGIPSEEICNGLDDDCDGVTDEPWRNPVSGLYDSLSACGACNSACGGAPAGASIACATEPSPHCATTCLPGFVDMDQNLANGCECLFQGAADSPDGIDQNCDGIDGDVTNVFVAKTGSDSNDGTRNFPVASIAKAQAIAVATGKHEIYVGSGVYSGSVNVVADIGMYGGYGPGFSEHDPVNFQTAIVGTVSSSGIAAGVRCQDVSGAGEFPTRLDSFLIIGPHATLLGTSAYGLLSSGCDSRVQITYCQIQSGDGAAGIPGGTGENGESGAAGGVGTAAHDVGHEGCGDDDTGAGGAGAVATCGGAGGSGGTAACPAYDEDNPPPACPAQPYLQTPAASEAGVVGGGDDVTAAAGGVGGASGADSYIDSQKGVATSCNNSKAGCNVCFVPVKPRDGVDGGDGKNGLSGTAGEGALAEKGSVLSGLWVPPSGGIGGSGQAGGGGGGGGAAGGVEVHDCALSSAKFTDVGGSGGGGGAGGCGGTGGLGGGGGGGSFAVFLIPTASGGIPQLLQNVLSSGNGGAGGAGGPAGSGGVGGLGGKGGSSGEGTQATFCTSQGGNGGAGGNAGHGGGGGGGCGGPSVLFTVVGNAVIGNNQFKTLGKGGPGGPGGPSVGAVGKSGFGGFSINSLNL